MYSMCAPYVCKLLLPFQLLLTMCYLTNKDKVKRKIVMKCGAEHQQTYVKCFDYGKSLQSVLVELTKRAQTRRLSLMWKSGEQAEERATARLAYTLFFSKNISFKSLLVVLCCF